MLLAFPTHDAALGLINGEIETKVFLSTHRDREEIPYLGTYWSQSKFMNGKSAPKLAYCVLHYTGEWSVHIQ